MLAFWSGHVEQLAVNIVNEQMSDLLRFEN